MKKMLGIFFALVLHSAAVSGMKYTKIVLIILWAVKPIFYSFHYYLNIARNTPAATAEPITPATFGPIACMSRKFDGFSF